MNNRIKVLKESTRPEIDWEGRHYVELNNGEKNKWMDEWFENFAELIVKECAQVCRDQPNHYALKADRDNCAIAIEEHFGVEE